jgi:hypothetical protein
MPAALEDAGGLEICRASGMVPQSGSVSRFRHHQYGLGVRSAVVGSKATMERPPQLTHHWLNAAPIRSGEGPIGHWCGRKGLDCGQARIV